VRLNGSDRKGGQHPCRCSLPVLLPLKLCRVDCIKARNRNEHVLSGLEASGALGWRYRNWATEIPSVLDGKGRADRYDLTHNGLFFLNGWAQAESIRSATCKNAD
jgi:hypothetical protein